MRRGEKWSCFALHEDGTWQQPTYRLDTDMTERQFSERVLWEFGGDYFLVVGIDTDEACADEDAKDLQIIS